jgi:hypothetical protein
LKSNQSPELNTDVEDHPIYEGGDFPLKNRRADVEKQYNIPPALIPYDGIAPVYDPQFVSSDESPLREDELVMGAFINGEAKAYPVTVLRFRETVNDELGGMPILVTW